MSLVSAAELAASLGDPDLRIADVRWSLAAPGGGRAAYAAAHIPGAVFVDLESVLTAPDGPGRHPLPDPAAFAAALAALGIGRGHRIVAYDDAGGTVAARLWWMLDALGHADVAVLDGGIAAWRAAGLPLTAEASAYLPAEPVATPGTGSAWPRTIDRSTLAGRLGEVRLLDARAPERYRGEIEPVDRIPGHIPTAVSLPTSVLLDGDGRFLTQDVLAARFAVVGVGGRRSRGAGLAPRATVRDGLTVGERPAGRRLVRQRRERVPARARDARGRAPRPAPLSRVVQRLDAVRHADRDRRRTGRGSASAARPTREGITAT